MQSKFQNDLRSTFFNVLNEFEFICAMNEYSVPRDFILHKIFHSPFEFKIKERDKDYSNCVFAILKKKYLLEFTIEKVVNASK